MNTASSRGDRGLIWIVQFSSAFSLGILAAFLYSVKAVNPEIRFELSPVTWLAFAFAAAGSVAFWHVVFKLTRNEGVGQAAIRRQKTALWTLATLLGLALLFAFGYPLKDFSSDKVSEIGFGAALAISFLAVLGFIFWRVVRYLEQEQPSDRA